MSLVEDHDTATTVDEITPTEAITHGDVLEAMRHANGNQPPTPDQLARGFKLLGEMVNEEFIKVEVHGGEKPRGYIRRKNGKDLFA